MRTKNFSSKLPVLKNFSALKHPSHLVAVDASNVDQGHHAVALDHLLAALRCHVRYHGDLVFGVWCERKVRADHQRQRGQGAGRVQCAVHGNLVASSVIIEY